MSFAQLSDSTETIKGMRRGTWQFGDLFRQPEHDLGPRENQRRTALDPGNLTYNRTDGSSDRVRHGLCSLRSLLDSGAKGASARPRITVFLAVVICFITRRVFGSLPHEVEGVPEAVLDRALQTVNLVRSREGEPDEFREKVQGALAANSEDSLRTVASCLIAVR